MKTVAFNRIFLSRSFIINCQIASLLAVVFLLCDVADAAELKVLRMGLGTGTITSNPAGINCAADCAENYGAATSVTLTATAAAGSTFLRWDGDADATTGTPDCAGTSSTCVVSMNVARSVRPVFNLTSAIPILGSFTPEGIQTYLDANPGVDDAARFVKALPAEYKQNWLLMARSESLQTATAAFPRILLPSANAQFVFSLGLVAHSAYPGAHPNAIEYMQWDAAEKNFRFHEIVLDNIPVMGSVPARTRGVGIDDAKCFACHSTRNVLNRGTTPGTTGIPIGIVKSKNKPNWDTYDSWGGMAPFNRDRIYQGSIEAAAFRKIFNPWSWSGNDFVRSVIEQLALQPPGVPAAHVITRTSGGANDGHVNFSFDIAPPVLVEPAPVGSAFSISTNYSFNAAAGSGVATNVVRQGQFVTLHHSDSPGSDEGRGVQLFDLLGGADGNLNPQRIADELVNHRFATGSYPIDVRPIALAITKFGCLSINETDEEVVGSSALTIDLGFFDSRNGMNINELVTDTRNRAFSIPRRKADIQKLTLDRTGDPYLVDPENGLIQQYGATTTAGLDTSLARIRQEVFRRSRDAGFDDRTVMGGIYVDRELESNITKIALYRYFLEPLGVSVDKWSMGVRGRSRSYTFADVLGSYLNVLQPALQNSLTTEPVAGLTDTNDCAQIITAVNNTLASLPPADGAGAIPKYTDIQRIFNKGCIECHGGLDYPPYVNYGNYLDFSENETPAAGERRMQRSHTLAASLVTTDPATSFLYDRITDYGALAHPYNPTGADERCPLGLMPCGGPPLSKVDIETIRRWIVGGSPYSEGDPHVRTINGVSYDFQSTGEHVLLRDEDLEIQARQTPVSTELPLGPNAHTGLTSCVSINSAVAVRVGQHRISYQPGADREARAHGLQLRVDGKLVTLGAQGIPLASGGRIIQTTAPGGINIQAPGGASVIVTPGWWDYYQLWYMNIDTRNVRATDGIMGIVAPGNWLPALPDGTLMGPRPRDLHQRYKDLYEIFGNAWRVTDATSLFDYAQGTSTSSFTLANWPGEAPQTCLVPPQTEGAPIKPPVKALDLEIAAQHCNGLVADDRKANCIQDVRVTGEPGFAKTYLQTEKIERNLLPVAPVLVFPENNQIVLTKPVTFNWNTTTDSDNDSLSYQYCVWPEGKQFNRNECISVPAQHTQWYSDIPILLIILICLLLIILILILLVMKRKPGLLVITILITLAALILVYYSGDNKMPAKPLAVTVNELESGKAYYWKVIADDGKGGTVESKTRRFEVK
ncbi:MAG: hypothetical protein ABW044_07565 [Cellvibrio sp.]